MIFNSWHVCRNLTYLVYLLEVWGVYTNTGSLLVILIIDSVYGLIYTACERYVFKWNSQVIGIYLSSPLRPRYLPERQKSRALTGSTFGIYSRFRSGMQTKQYPVDSLNFFNDTLLITVMLVSVQWESRNNLAVL